MKNINHEEHEEHEENNILKNRKHYRIIG